MKKQISENACCAKCKKRGAKEGEFYICEKKGKVRETFVCKKYEFDPFAKRVGKIREFDSSMFDPLDFDINS